jgi:ubiquinone/menaquinone biosynthesis C-methylase UbiE
VSLGAAWEENAEAWVALVRGEDNFFGPVAETFVELLPPPPARTLDVGCGEGRLGALLAERGYAVVGVDASPTMVRYAQERHEAFVADAAALPIADAHFDVVIAFMCLHDMDDLDGAVRETARVLVPAGRFCIALKHPFLSASGRRDDLDQATLTRPYHEPFVYEPRIGGRSMHRPVQDYAAALERAGFLIDTLRELAPADRPHLPGVLLIRAVKA